MFDLVKNINRVVPKGIEFHAIDQADDGSIRRASFTGPNTNLKARLENLKKDGTYTNIITPPINDLDEAALAHDLAYYSNKDLAARHEADLILADAAQRVIDNPNATTIQRQVARLVKVIMLGKTKLGIGVLDQFNPDIVGPLAGDRRRNLANLLVGLIAAAASVGIPALIKKFKEKNGEGFYF